MVRPFLKWAGGKRRLIPRILPLLPAAIGTYHEPFLGSGAVFFELANQGRFRHAVLSDVNGELITTHRAVRDHVDTVIELLKRHRGQHSQEHFYATRALDPLELCDTEAAARMIYLNKTCFNGLYRVNKRGGFNVPFGRYKNPAILDEENLRACSGALQRAELHVADFGEALQASTLGTSDAVYLDPPYFPLNGGSFGAYDASGFDAADQARLEAHASALKARGATVVISNADTEASRALYREWQIESFGVQRPINSKAAGRGEAPELLAHGLRVESEAAE